VPYLDRTKAAESRADTEPARHPILFFSAAADYYGAPRSLHLLVSALQARGEPVQVAVAANGTLAERLRADGVRVWVSPVDPYGPTKSARRLPAAVRKLTGRVWWGFWAGQTILRTRPRLVYLNTLRGATVALSAALLRIPIIWHLRGLETGTSHPAFRQLRLKLVALLARRIVAVSGTVADAARAAGCPAEKLTVAYNGIAAPALRDLAAQQRPRVTLPADFAPRTVVGYVGRLDPNKGILDFLESTGRFASRGNTVGFLLIGGPLADENADWDRIGPAIDAARARGARVHVTGFTNQPYGLMDRCHILVLPSHDEGFPRVVLEAMALGKAIVATAVGGVPEAITSDTHGILTPPKDPDGLAAAMARLLDDEALRGRLGSAARARVERDFTPDATINAVQRALHAVDG
jgi:glycosyltransferase involved in cell wall biosynthesis